MKRSLTLALLLSAVAARCGDLAAHLEVRDTLLANGLRVLVHRDASVPSVSCRLFYATGSVHEHPGNTGIAHMLEHMLFKGTRKVGTTDSTADAKFLPLLDSLDDLRRAAREAGDTASVRFLSASMDSLSVLHRATFVKEELWQAYREAVYRQGSLQASYFHAWFASSPAAAAALFGVQKT